MFRSIIMAEITAPITATDQGSKKPTLDVETSVAGVPQDPAAAGKKIIIDEGNKLDPNVTAELTPTNSTATISSPKDTVVSPIANEVSVETSGLITTDTTLSPSSAGTGGDAEVEVETKENFEIEAAESKETETNEANEVDDDAALKMQQMVVTGSRILLKKHDVAEEDVDDDDDAKMSLIDFADLVGLLVERGGLTAAQGNLLFDHAEVEADRNGGLINGPLKTSYCVAEWAKDAVYLCEGLSALSETIAVDAGMAPRDDGGASCLSMSTIDFLLEASETTFLESLRKDTLIIPSGGADDHDLDDDDVMSPENFWALHHAILVSHPAIVAVYEGYKRSLVKALDLSCTLNGGEDIETASAEKTEDECIGSALEFLLHALKRVGLALEPIPMGEDDEEEEDDGYDEEMAKKASTSSSIVATGDIEDRTLKSSSGSMTFVEELDSLAQILDTVVANLPESLQILAYSLLTEGDAYLVECLKDYIRDGDIKQVQEDILVRLQVAVKSMEHDAKLDKLIDAAEKRDAETKGSYEDADDDDVVVPKSIVAAAATLVEHGRISEEAATFLVSKVALADEDSSLSQIYEYFHATGNVVTFLQSLELYAAQCDENSLGLSSGEYGTVLAKAVTDSFTEMLELPLEEEDDDGAFIGEAGAADVKAILKEATGGFTPLEIQALRVATARNEESLDKAILHLQATGDTLSFTMQLLRIAHGIIAKTRREMAERKAAAMGGFEE